MVRGFNKDHQFTEWKTIRTAVMGDSLIAIQKLTKETGDVRYKVVAKKE